MTKNEAAKTNEAKKVVKRVVVDDKIVVKTISSRIKDDCKAVKLNVVDETKVNACHTQASCIDACVRASFSVEKIINKLVELKLCTNESAARARVIRHFKSDKASRVIKRNAML